MSTSRKSVYLLADSHQLFWPPENNSLISMIREDLDVNSGKAFKAAYLGMSNGDQTEFYQLFQAAMNNIGAHEARMVKADAADEDLDFLKEANLLLLAGGEVGLGWSVMQKAGYDAIFTERFLAGSVLVGVSAGAVQLGMGFKEEGQSFISTTKIVPFYIDAHDEQRQWCRLKSLLGGQEDFAKGYGIPKGGAMVVHADTILEPLQIPVEEFFREPSANAVLRSNILMPRGVRSDDVS
ncbi:Type 1 glutamine amidotransferase-like domain-containing protein [Microbulbifer sp. 2201CG32-9]|uniref:Type 1 glutamine amidotransferase-like domain-containing protein n=1 Tax=Microbulbifer sp. 2201CG32-9 TaxID=3232309 RepID=UPI00345C0311